LLNSVIVMQFPSRRKDATWEKIFWKGMEGTWAQE